MWGGNDIIIIISPTLSAANVGQVCFGASAEDLWTFMQSGLNGLATDTISGSNLSVKSGPQLMRAIV
ncbi:hypothetical protein KUF71_002212 [Frankliniella fusca]|uniref:Uncharacterized protein n=1 Tax=Frankliniella fusca TaxID=407009 RepID=A0AAE1HM98_9NEOP|nr:hypothetical protein KUF71_002212 [Frankliniella fusca]